MCIYTFFALLTITMETMGTRLLVSVRKKISTISFRSLYSFILSVILRSRKIRRRQFYQIES